MYTTFKDIIIVSINKCFGISTNVFYMDGAVIIGTGQVDSHWLLFIVVADCL